VKKSQKTLVLLDAHAIIHRAYHALPQFSSSSGEPTGALFGVGNMLLRVINEVQPDYVVACYDLPQKTFRHHAYEHYKAGRAKAEDSLVRQIETSRELFKALSVPFFLELINFLNNFF
jgi:DNA polymerase-1